MYAGKICAALDRQHPRDLYDVHWLLEHEGINERLKNAFLVYLMQHNRPMAELLSPKMQEIEVLYREELDGMSYERWILSKFVKPYLDWSQKFILS